MAEARSLMAWLSEQVSADQSPFRDFPPQGLPAAPTRLQFMAALMVMDTGGYGFISGGRGLYGREGLEQHEAYTWWDLRSFVNGWLEATGNAEQEALKAALKAEWARVEALSREREQEGAGDG